MIGALWTGISGLSAHQKALDNESHNIANVNTVGYKASRMSFADQMYQDKIGKGTAVLDAEKLYTQGNLKVTGVSFDMALSGTGFFSVSNTRSSGTTETFYTRAGNFRMGDSGTLQDTSGNEVQGWAMSTPLGNDDVVTSNQNVTNITSDYSKLIASKVIAHSNYIETITAKATDYTQTAKADDESIYTGYGLKTQAGKVADVEALINDYGSWLQKLKDDPDGPSATSVAQKSFIDLPNNTANGAIAGEGDQVYIYLDGSKIYQNFDTSYSKTMQLLADKISTVPGYKAYIADAAYESSTTSKSLGLGNLRIESMIPGKAFNISEAGMIKDGVTTQGVSGNIQASVTGSGIGALESSMAALEKAVVGNQEDVFTPDDLQFNALTTDFKYQIEIFDKTLNKNVTVPTKALAINNPSGIDDFVDTINNDTSLSKYIKAENINGNLIIKTVDSYFDVEFASKMYGSDQELQTIQISSTTKEVQTITLGSSVEEVQTVTITATATDGPVTFLGSVVEGTGAGDTASSLSTKILADSDNIIQAWNAANPTKQIKSIEAGSTNSELNITFESSSGDVADLVISTNHGASFSAAEVTPGGTVDANVSFLGYTVGTSLGDTVDDLAVAINTDKAAIIAGWNGISGNKQIESISVDRTNPSAPTVTITYKDDQGDAPAIEPSANKSATFAEVETTKGATAIGAVTFLGTEIPGSQAGDTVDQTLFRILATKDTIITNWNAENPGKEIEDITGSGDTLTVLYKRTEGNVSQDAESSNNGMTFGAATQIVQGESAVTGIVKRNADYSGRAGAGAEFIQITNNIDQTGTKGAMQLRLDTLGISDSAFGEFSIDSTGLITIKQDGAEFAVGQVAIALFNNERGLEPTGDNLLKATAESGEAFYNLNNDKTAKIEAQTLELSTADLSESLVNLMVFQRAFEANAKSITTSDEILNTLINLKR